MKITKRTQYFLSTKLKLDGQINGPLNKKCRKSVDVISMKKITQKKNYQILLRFRQASRGFKGRVWRDNRIMKGLIFYL